jgi:hypothetical protein
MSNSTRRRVLTFAVAAAVAAIAAMPSASASNMAFKINKQVCQLAIAPTGQNLVSFPWNSPYKGPGGLDKICQACGLSNSAQVTEWTGTGSVLIHQCGQVPQFTLQDGVGVMITEPTATKNCIFVGSDQPGKAITVQNLGVAPVGINMFPVDYHTTAVTPQDLCTDCGLSNTATVTRFNACSGQVLTHQCGQTAQWNLVLGEAVMILENQGTRVCHPSHF